MNRQAKFWLALVVAAVCGGIVTVAVRGTPAPAAPSPPALSTSAIVRTDLSSTVLAQGTLGYASSPPVINQLAGTYTSLPAAGDVVQPGQALYRVDEQPVVLFQGGIPAWRPFGPGMTDGPDIEELEANLLAFGDAVGLFTTPGAHFSTATAAAVERWQQGAGLVPTGGIALGTVAFLPGTTRVGAVTASLGQPAAPGDEPFHVTTSGRTVSVPLTPNDPTVSVGQSVSIALPSNATTPGHVIAVEPAPAATSGATEQLTITPDDPGATGAGDQVTVEVSLTVQSVHHVLAVPIAALVALAGGGYGLELANHQLIGVHVGVFAGGRVQVSGPGLKPGQRVVVAQ